MEEKIVVNPDPKETEQKEVEPEKEVQDEQEVQDDQFELFQDLLDDDDAEEDENSLSDEQRRKNKDAEEARKRREAEAKAKAEAEAEEKEKAEAEAKAKAEEEAKARAEAEKEKETKQGERVNKLGSQLVTFTQKYPDVDLVNLDKDDNFKKFIDGQLLGKKDFTALYEEYVELRSALSGKTQQDVQKDYAKKAKSSSGTATPKGTAETQEVFTEAELQNIAARLPFMSDEATAKIEAKLQRSIEYYEKQK